MPDPTETPEFDPFTRLVRPDGSLDLEMVGRHLATLHDLLLRHEDCLELRADVEETTALLTGDAGRALRDADDDAAADEALRAFSRTHLHELFDEAALARAVERLNAIAEDEDVPRKTRIGAATGVALAGSLPDDRGFRGHGLADVLLRVTMEEIHAHQTLVVHARDEGGLDPEELAKFWGEYPGLRHRFEQRYRRDVARVLDDIEHDLLPEAVSVDLAVRGAHRLLALSAAFERRGEPLPAESVRELLFETFEDDLLDGGRELVLARWQTIASDTAAEERLRRAADRAARIAATPSPGSEAVYFQAYARAVVSGCFHVLDEDEARAGRGAFAEAGLAPAGLLAYARHLRASGRFDDASRVFEAAYELWPHDETVRAAAAADAAARIEDARAQSFGPRYEQAATDAPPDDVAHDGNA